MFLNPSKDHISSARASGLWGGRRSAAPGGAGPSSAAACFGCPIAHCLQAGPPKRSLLPDVRYPPLLATAVLSPPSERNTICESTAPGHPCASLRLFFLARRRDLPHFDVVVPREAGEADGVAHALNL